MVVGHGLIQERNINTGETVEFEVSGDKIEAVHMTSGWIHNIINLSDTDNLVTVTTCNEIISAQRPDAFFKSVMKKAKELAVVNAVKIQMQEDLSWDVISEQTASVGKPISI